MPLVSHSSGHGAIFFPFIQFENRVKSSSTWILFIGLVHLFLLFTDPYIILSIPRFLLSSAEAGLQVMSSLQEKSDRSMDEKKPVD